MIFSVTILGCSSAIPTPVRSLSAQVVNVHEKLYLIDCGEGTQMQLRKFNIKAQRINHIFISHLHGDHYYGLIGLLTSSHLLGRTNPLHIYAEAKLKDIINIQFSASDTHLGYPLNFHDIDPTVHEKIFEDEKVTVYTIPLKHRLLTTGFLFKEKAGERNIRKDFVEKEHIPYSEFSKIKAGGDYISDSGLVFKNRDITIDPPEPRSFAYCSDTAYFEPIIPKIKHVDLLYHEATFMDDKKDKASENFHSTTIEAATIAKKAEVKRLILGHYSTRYDDLQLLLKEARSVFPNTELGEDGKVFEIEL